MGGGAVGLINIQIVVWTVKKIKMKFKFLKMLQSIFTIEYLRVLTIVKLKPCLLASFPFLQLLFFLSFFIEKERKLFLMFYYR